MRNHVHLVVETRPGGANLGEALRLLTSKLALAINRSIGRKGPVYRDRYFSRPLRSLSELIVAIRYVALNPVKAKIVVRAELYPSSAVHDYMGDTLAKSPWRTRGWMYQKLGFLEDPRTALREILEGRRRPVVHQGGHQLRLPFGKGLPKIRS